MDRPLVPFVAIATFTNNEQLNIESHYCALTNNDNEYLAFVEKKLKSIREVSAIRGSSFLSKVGCVFNFV